VKLFASNDRAIRVSLLQHIDQFGESLAAQTVDEQVCDIFVYGYLHAFLECWHLTGVSNVFVGFSSCCHRVL
jgi:SCY1-like protein 1